MTRPFTGWHATGIIVAFFGVVIAVNVLMATLATQTFGGTVVDNSYVASQQFNTWIAAGRAQRTLGWSAKVDLDATRRVRIGGHLPFGAVVTAVATHPLGATPDRTLAFVASPGGFVSTAALPAGRFLVHVKVRAAGHVADFNDEVPA